MTQAKPLIIAIVGPTSSGKTAVSAEIAKKINCEIISCDSMQIYRDMDIVTSAPCDKILSQYTHHLVKIIPPEEEYNAMRFSIEAGRIIPDVLGRNRTPLIVGGTGLYLKALVDGIFPSPGKDEEYRGKLEELAAAMGKEHIFRELEKIDPATASRLHPNDTRRVIRALEVYRLTGIKMSEGKLETSGSGEKYDFRVFALKVPREVLYDRINRHVEKMFADGVVDEVKKLDARDLSVTASKALGVGEIKSLLSGEIDEHMAVGEMKKNTRRYAKRQMTWFRADPMATWIDADRPVGEIAGDILKRIG